MSELPRILLCSFDVLPSPCGASRRMTEYLRGFNGRYSTVVLSTKTPDVSHIERYHGARLLRVPVGTGDLATRAQAFERAVKRQLESEDYALVHFMDPFGGYPLCELRGTYSYKIVYDAQSFPSQELRFTHPQLDGDRKLLAKVRRQELYCLMNADLVLTGSALTQKHITSLGVSPDNVKVLRAPIDLGLYASKCATEPTSPVLRMIYVGTQVGWQGLPTVLRALKQALTQVEANLTLVGPRHPEWQRRLEELVAELGLTNAVKFHPAVPADELPALLAQSDVGLIPLDDVERNRIQGGELSKASDYLGAGRPVVASDLALTRELLPASATRFFPPGDDAKLAGILVELARSPEQRATLGRAAREEAQRSVAASSLRTVLLGLYGELVRRGGTASTTEVPSASSDTMTATPTNKLLAGKPDSGPTPTGRVTVDLTPTGGRAPEPPQPDTDPALAVNGPKWAAANGAVQAPSRPAPGGALPQLPEPEAVEEVATEDILERIDTWSGPAPRAPVTVSTPAPGDDALWLAQLLFGYCPPEGAQAARPTPPTNFPGRDTGAGVGRTPT